MTETTAAPSHIQPALLSRMNERQVLRAIQQNGPMSRAEVARHAGISAPTASKAVESLLRSGWLEEGEAPELVRGRPARKVRLPERMSQVLGLVIDADRCHVVAAGLDGSLREEHASFVTPGSYAELIRMAAQYARTLMGHPEVRTLGMGVSVPGLIDYRQQRGILSPNVPITNDHTPAADLAAELQLDCVLIQESHSLCLAERYYGNARGLDNFAMLDATSGVGLGVMSGGQLLTGHRGLAGEVGHITVIADGRLCGCGNLGCLETVACDSAVASQVSRRLSRRVTVSDIVLARENPGRADEIVEASRDAIATMAEYLAIGVSAVINLFNPSTLFIHSALLSTDSDLFDRFLSAAQRRTLRPSFADCDIVPARGSKSHGAIAAAIERLLDDIVPIPNRASHYLSRIGAARDLSVPVQPDVLRVREVLHQ